MTGTLPRRRPRWPWWVGGGLLGFLATVAIIVDIVAHRAEPFVREQIVEALSARFHARVELDSLHLSVGNTLRGEWGVWGEGHGLRIWPPAEVEGVQVPQPNPPGPPLINLAEFHFHAPLRYGSGEPIHISQIRLKGLDIRFPPRSRMLRLPNSQAANQNAERTASSNPSFAVDAVDCKSARFTLETDKPNKLPLQFVINSFHLKDVRSGAPMMFEADLENPKPPGLIHTTGAFGPWVVADPGSSAVRGDYTFKNADLSVFKGIAGTLDSTGHYLGILRNIAVEGETNTPDFQLSHVSRSMPLHTVFDARVDGTSGDTWLNAVNATLGTSRFTIRGHVVRVLRTGSDGNLHSVGHDIALDVDVNRGRIEDFLRLAVNSAVPMMDGDIAVKAQVHIPPGSAPVSERIGIHGHFILDNAEFTSASVEKRIRELSLRGQGKTSELKSVEDEKVKSHAEGDFALDGGVLTVPAVTYSVPGADIQMHGIYRAHGGTLDFTGTAKLQATISQIVGGWKGMLLKPADRFFKKHGAGTEVPIYIAGTRDKPQFGYNGAHGGGTHPQRPDTQ